MNIRDLKPGQRVRITFEGEVAPTGDLFRVTAYGGEIPTMFTAAEVAAPTFTVEPLDPLPSTPHPFKRRRGLDL